MNTTIQTPPRKRDLDLEYLIIELGGVSALMTALSIPFCNGTDRISDKLTADALNALHLYIDRIADDIGEFTV
jgi:hypothetical protein